MVWGSWPRRVIVVAVVVGFLLRLWWILYVARTPVALHDPTHRWSSPWATADIAGKQSKIHAARLASSP